MIHELKTWPEPYDEIVAGTKTFEYRRNDDRHFRQGDLLILKEWDPVAKEYTGREATARIGFVVCGYDAINYGIPEDYAVLSITRAWTRDADNEVAGWMAMQIPVDFNGMAGTDFDTAAHVARLREFTEEGGARA